MVATASSSETDLVIGICPKATELPLAFVLPGDEHPAAD